MRIHSDNLRNVIYKMHGSVRPGAERWDKLTYRLVMGVMLTLSPGAQFLYSSV